MLFSSVEPSFPFGITNLDDNSDLIICIIDNNIPQPTTELIVSLDIETNPLNDVIIIDGTNAFNNNDVIPFGLPNLFLNE